MNHWEFIVTTRAMREAQRKEKRAWQKAKASRDQEDYQQAWECGKNARVLEDR